MHRVKVFCSALLISTVLSGCGKGVVDAEQITTLEGADELPLQAIDLDSLRPLNAGAGFRAARKQAAAWNDRASLLTVFQSAFLVDDEGKMLPLLWTYRFRNGSGDAWLGVVVSNKGIEQVMQRPTSPTVLSEWQALDQLVDAIDWDLGEEGYTALMGIGSANEPDPVWFDHASVWLGSIEVADAVSGEKRDWQPLLEVLQAKPSLFGTTMAEVSEQSPWDKDGMMFYPAGSRALSPAW